MNPRVAAVGCLAAPDLDDDFPLVRNALADQGCTFEFAAWDDPAVDWGSFDLLVIRGTWDNIVHPADYLAWAGAAATTAMLNPVAALSWNIDKRHLADLASAGLPIVPTTWVEPADDWSETASDFVVKPAISGGALDTARYGAHDIEQARRHVRRLQAEGRTVMVQPYMPAVDVEGECALVYLGGEFSHAVQKGPMLEQGAGIVDRLWERWTLTPTSPTAAQLRLATDTITAFPEAWRDDLLYCRIDVVHDDEGQPLLLEVELIDPTLFLHLHHDGIARFATCILDALERLAL